MTTFASGLHRLIDEMTHDSSFKELEQKLRPNTRLPLPSLRLGRPGAISERWGAIDHEEAEQILRDDSAAPSYGANIEHYIGEVRMPIGLAGPLRVNGLNASGDYWLPLATHEAALVASYARGARLISEAGGCSSLLTAEGVTRAPVFAFPTVAECGRFVHWLLAHESTLVDVAGETTRYGQLTSLRPVMEGNHVYLTCTFTTGDAAGQNMITIATQAMCDYIIEHSPVCPEYWFVEGNASGDKKASATSFSSVRGKRIVAEVVLPKALVEARLHTTPERMIDYWRVSAIGGVLTGTIGVQGHYANGLAALFIATGQDAACVAEAAVGVTRFEIQEDGALYASVTLPNLIVGTVGGGTGLPTQSACLDVMGLAGTGKARAFAEVCAGLALAGELSIIGALAAHEFSSAHARLARGRRRSNV